MTHYNLELDRALLRIKERIDLMYIHALSSFEREPQEKDLTETNIKKYLKKKGYTSNTLLGKEVMTKGFVVVSIQEGYLEVWNDTHSNTPKSVVKDGELHYIYKDRKHSVFVDNEYLTYLPITLNYMEKINN